MAKKDFKEIEYTDIPKRFGNGTHLIIPKDFEGKLCQIKIINLDFNKECVKEQQGEQDDKGL